MGSARQGMALLVFVLLSFGAGAIGSLATARAIPEWYNSLVRPSWSPPNWVFGPVWTLLYLMMGIAAWLVWREAGGVKGAAGPLGLFLAQLAFNASWSLIFFGLRRPDWAFAEIVVLWVLILATLIAFWRATALAGVLLLPYLLWATFASGLNHAIWRLNAR